MVVLFNTVLLLRGKLNFKNLARHSELDEKTYRRWFRGKFNFEAFNLRCIEQRAVKGDMVVAMDASFIPKSGKKTFGLGKFYNGCKGRAERGLEISELALIDRRSRVCQILCVNKEPLVLRILLSELFKDSMALVRLGRESSICDRHLIPN